MITTFSRLFKKLHHPRQLNQTDILIRNKLNVHYSHQLLHETRVSKESKFLQAPSFLCSSTVSVRRKASRRGANSVIGSKIEVRQHAQSPSAACDTMPQWKNAHTYNHRLPPSSRLAVSPSCRFRSKSTMR